MFDAEQALKRYDDFVHFTKSLEELRETEDGTCCLLKNHPGAAAWFYEQSHGDLHLELKPMGPNYEVCLYIHSIDDGSIPVFGPVEGLEAATKRRDLVLNHIKSWDGWIPTAEQVQKMEQECGMWWNR